MNYKEATQEELEIINKEREIGRAVESQIAKLPQLLRAIWEDGSQKMNRENFFNEASQHIDIPHPDRWDGSIGIVEMLIKKSDDIDIFVKYDAVQLMMKKLKSVNVPPFSDGSYRVSTIDKDGNSIETQVMPNESED